MTIPIKLKRKDISTELNCWYRWWICVFKYWSIVDKHKHVGYFHTIFEYLLTIFVWVLVPSELVVVPSRTRRALSNALFTSHLQTILSLQDCKNMLKTTENPAFFSKCSPYSLERLFGGNSRWFQVELDELYRMDYLLLRKNVNACLKC